MKKVLIIRFSALGDVAMLAPIVRIAAETYPDVSFTMLSQQRFADIFAGMPSNVVFHGVDLKKQTLHEIVQELGSFDYVADMHGVLRSIYIRTVYRYKGASVASISKGRWDKIRLTHGWSRRQLNHTTERYATVFANICHPILLKQNPDKTSIKPRQGIGIAPFAAHTGKIYPIERMEQVVEKLSEKGEHIVLFGGKGKEQATLAHWAEKYPGVESIAGQKTLREELEIMSSLRVMLTMDSGNMHLASLVGTRVVSIWGASHPFAGFLGIGQKEADCIQRELACRPCSIYGEKKCKYGDYRCMDISPEEIVKKLTE